MLWMMHGRRLRYVEIWRKEEWNDRPVWGYNDGPPWCKSLGQPPCQNTASLFTFMNPDTLFPTLLSPLFHELTGTIFEPTNSSFVVHHVNIPHFGRPPFCDLTISGFFEYYVSSRYFINMMIMDKIHIII